MHDWPATAWPPGNSGKSVDATALVRDGRSPPRRYESPSVPASDTGPYPPPGEVIEFDPRVRSNYRRIQGVDLRYADVDSLGHVTSLSFLACFETARVQFIHDAGRRVDDPEHGWMLVKLDSDFLGQLHFPGRVDVATRLSRLGRTSVTTMQGLFVGDSCCATLRSVLVHVDRALDRPADIPADLAARLRQVDQG